MAKGALEGEKTERELKLEKSLKDRETRISELEDENSRLKAPAARPRPPAPRREGWLAGTFLEDL